MSLRTSLKSSLTTMADVMRIEFAMVLRDPGVVLILILAILIYSTLYALGYKNQVVHDVPIAVIDQDNTVASRNLVEAVDNGANVEFEYMSNDMEEIKRLYWNRDIYGAMFIPKGYEKSIASGGQATVSIYCDGTYFLLYRQALADFSSVITSMGTSVEFQRLLMKGTGIETAHKVSQPIIYQSRTLFNTGLGYGTYVMPSIFILIVQQTALIGIGMIGGTWRERNYYRKLIPEGRNYMSTLPIILGKALVYCLIYAVTTTYVFCVHYQLFGYPMNGQIKAIMAVLVPYVLGCVMMSIFVSTFFRRREHSILFLLWISIPSLLISGVSLPPTAFPHYLSEIAKILPSTDAVNAFIRVQTMGADIRHILPELNHLWIKAFVYGVLAILTMHVFIVKNYSTAELVVLRRNRDLAIKRLEKLHATLKERRKQRRENSWLYRNFYK